MESAILEKIDATFTMVGMLVETVGGLSDRIDTLTGRMDTLSGRVDLLAVKVEDLSGRVGVLEFDMIDVKNGVARIELRVESIDERLETEQLFTSDLRDAHARRLSRIERHLGFMK